MLTEMAVADSYGAGFEYAPAGFVRKYNTLEGFIQHPRHDTVAPGTYTDDTQMSIGLARLMLNKDPANWTFSDLAHYWLNTFKRDERDGYARGFQKFLESCNEPADFLRGIRPHSAKSGGAMRAGVIGLFPETQTVVDRAMFQASLTHATLDGMLAAAASALMAHYCYYDMGAKVDLVYFLEDWTHRAWDDQWEGRVGAPGLGIVEAALTALVTLNSTADILRECIAFTGDTDTVAAIAMCAASVCQEVEQNLPESLFDGLEDGKFGKTYLARLDEELRAAFPKEPEEDEEGEPDIE